MDETCRHARMRTSIMFLEPEDPHGPRRLAISTSCDDCGQPFEFVGVEGAGTKLSADRRELGLTIAEVNRSRVQ